MVQFLKVDKEGTNEKTGKVGERKERQVGFGICVACSMVLIITTFKVLISLIVIACSFSLVSLSIHFTRCRFS